MLWDAELPAGEIAAGVRVTAGTVSSHLTALREAGLVAVRVDGNFRHYRVDRAAMEAGAAAAGRLRRQVARGRRPPRARPRHRARSSSGSPSTPTWGLAQEEAFASFADGERYSAWLGVPVTIEDGRFSTRLEWGTRVRGHYDVVAPPDLIAMRWDFDDDVIPVPGGQVVGYLRFHPHEDGCRVEVHQCAADTEQAEFLTVAWQMVLGRFKEWADLDRRTPRPLRPKHRPTGG